VAEKNWQARVQIIPDHKSEKVTKSGARLTKVSKNSLTLAFMNIIIDVTYLTSGIYTDFHSLLRKKCDIGY